MMAAYVIADIVEISDPVQYEDYKKMVPASIAAYGGRFIARGGRTEALEGDWRPGRLVIIEFENAERAKAWWASEEYGAVKALRQRVSTGSLVVIEGIEG
jgi:uncharacterized protein (DUF1330 family)